MTLALLLKDRCEDCDIPFFRLLSIRRWYHPRLPNQIHFIPLQPQNFKSKYWTESLISLNAQSCQPGGADAASITVFQHYDG